MLLMFVGTSDIMVSHFVFGKAVRKAEEAISSATSPEQEKTLQNQLKTKLLIRNALRLAGFVFIFLGIFGLLHR
jgi:hypothetical protein